MDGWKVSEFGKIEKTSDHEAINEVDQVKIRITSALITDDDVAHIVGEDKTINLPIIPGKMAVGQVTATGVGADYLEKGTRVVLSSATHCGKCANCTQGNTENCYQYNLAGKTSNGFLRDFAVMNASDVYALPQSVKDSDAIFIEYVALALSVIDRLKLEKGDHIAVIGANVFGSILAQLLIYYQAVPIIIDSSETNLKLAKNSGIYYTLPVNAKTEREILSITGGRMANGVVYVARSGVSTDLAYKVASPSAKIVFAGLSYPNVKVSLSLALSKQLSSICVSNGYGNYLAAINLLANKAIDLSSYKPTQIKLDKVEETVNELIDKFNKKQEFNNVIINMLG